MLQQQVKTAHTCSGTTISSVFVHDY